MLNWLIAGSDALAYANLSDEELIDAALKSLPASLGDARAHFLEGKIHRWLSSVNALPGGLPVRDVMTNHRPEPKEHPGIVVVGDYLFDSTLNGLLDSSDAATDIVVTEMMRLRRARAQDEGALSDKIDRGYFDNYRGVGPYGEVWRTFTDPAYLTDLIKTVWGRAKGYKLLIAGSASGELVGALRERGIDAGASRTTATSTARRRRHSRSTTSSARSPTCRSRTKSSTSCSRPRCAISARSRSCAGCASSIGWSRPASCSRR